MMLKVCPAFAGARPTLSAAEGMATYRYTNTTATGASLKLNERAVYGSSRLGSLRKEEELRTVLSFQPQDANPIQQVDLNYELTDHLGNVTAVITGRLLDGNGGGTPKQAELVSAQGYEAFGSLLPGRNYSSGSYRYLFQGQEHDDELYGSEGTSYAFEYRIHDARVGRFLSIDPLTAKYPYMTPYQFAGNKPIWSREIEGLESEVDAQVIPAAAATTGTDAERRAAILTDPSTLNSTRVSGRDPLQGPGSTGSFGGDMHMKNGTETEKSIKTTKPTQVGTTDGSYIPGKVLAGMSPTGTGVPKGKDVDDWDDWFEEGADLLSELGAGIDALSDVIESWWPSDASSSAKPVLQNGNSQSVEQTSTHPPLVAPPQTGDTVQAEQYYEYLHVVGGDSTIPVPKGRTYGQYKPHTTSPSRRGL